jgi:HK97 family phage prohead protease
MPDEHKPGWTHEDGKLYVRVDGKPIDVTPIVEPLLVQRGLLTGDESRVAGDCLACNGTGEVNGETCGVCSGSGEQTSIAGQQQNAAGLISDEAMIIPDPELEQRKSRVALLDGMTETRQFHASAEIRKTSDGGLRFTGWPSVTERAYEVSDFQETIARGAFKRTLGEDPDVFFRIEHAQLPIARTKSGTMTLSEDSRGLRVDADLEPSDPDVQALMPKMERGDVTDMSFAFRATEQAWNEDRTERLIRSVSLHKGDVSIVTAGANPAATGELSHRSADTEEERPEPEEKPEPPKVVVRSYIETAKARRAKLRRSR